MAHVGIGVFVNPTIAWNKRPGTNWSPWYRLTTALQMLLLWLAPSPFNRRKLKDLPFKRLRCWGEQAANEKVWLIFWGWNMNMSEFRMFTVEYGTGMIWGMFFKWVEHYFWGPKRIGSEEEKYETAMVSEVKGNGCRVGVLGRWVWIISSGCFQGENHHFGCSNSMVGTFSFKGMSPCCTLHTTNILRSWEFGCNDWGSKIGEWQTSCCNFGS